MNAAVDLGILHPGAMGASVAKAAARALARVWFASAGRSAQTLARARDAGLADAGTLKELVARCEIVLSVCPPDAALGLAREVAAHMTRGIYVDANAIAPATAREIECIFANTDVAFVDGGIIGPPAHAAGTTRLHLCGARASEVARCFATGPLDAFVLEGPAGAASALKMVFAAWTKGSAALLAAIHAAAGAEGVERELEVEWQKSLPDLPGRLQVGAKAIAPKAWRFAGEMREISRTFADAGIPPGFFDAAAQVYERLAGFKDGARPPTPDEVADALRKPR